MRGMGILWEGGRSVDICIHKHTHAHIHTCTHTHTCAHTHTYTHEHIHTHAHTHMRTYTHMHPHIYYTHIHTCCIDASSAGSRYAVHLTVYLPSPLQEQGTHVFFLAMYESHVRRVICQVREEGALYGVKEGEKRGIIWSIGRGHYME